MGKKKRKQRTDEEAAPTRPTLPAATSKLLGAWLGLFALAMTYVAAVLSGVSAPTALLRASIAWVVFSILGRIIGTFIGRSMEASLRADEPAPVPVTVDAEESA